MVLGAFKLFWRKLSSLKMREYVFPYTYGGSMKFDASQKQSFPGFLEIQCPSYLFKTDGKKQTSLGLLKRNNYMLQWATQFKNHPHLTIHHST